MRPSPRPRWVPSFVAAFTIVGGCTSLTAIDWSQVDDVSPGNGGNAGSVTAGSSNLGAGGMNEGGADDGGAAGEGGERNPVGGSGGQGGLTDGSGGRGGTTAGTGGTTAGTGGTGGTEPAPVCGDGKTEGNECEPPTSSLCSNACVAVATQACVDCEQNGNCWEFTNSCIDNTTTPADQAKCFSVQACIATSNCADGTNTLTSCFCGALTTGECIAAPSSGASAPSGACASVIREAMGGSGVSNSQVLTRFTNIVYPGGAAIARYNCTKLDPGCSAVCGF